MHTGSLYSCVKSCSSIMHVAHVLAINVAVVAIMIGVRNADASEKHVTPSSPVLDKDAGSVDRFSCIVISSADMTRFTHATNAQITTLAEIEGPVDRLPASGNLSEVRVCI